MSRSDNDLLLESIQICDGIPQRLDLHQDRVDRSRAAHFAGAAELSLSEVLEVPEEMQRGLVKCRVTYGAALGSIEYRPYTVRMHSGITIVDGSRISYPFKYNDRTAFRLLEAASADNAVIISQNGFLTDATYANLALYDGEQWVTPFHYLLNGVMRQSLLECGRVTERPIPLSDIARYSQAKLVNAMLEWDSSPIIRLSDSIQ